MSLNPFAQPFEPDHRTVVERRGDQVVVAKAGDSPASRHRLAHEAAVLARARRPGVVELVDHHDDGRQATLVTAWVGTHTLATVTVRSVDQVAGLVAVLADTVEALHLLGIIHGRITPEHVVLDGQGYPVLVGFGSASLDGDTDKRFERADDVAALGRLLSDLLDSVPTEGVTGRSRADRRRRTALADLARQTMVDDRWARPSAHRLAVGILTAVPGARPADTTVPATGPPPATTEPAEGPSPTDGPWPPPALDGGDDAEPTAERPVPVAPEAGPAGTPPVPAPPPSRPDAPPTLTYAGPPSRAADPHAGGDELFGGPPPPASEGDATDPDAVPPDAPPPDPFPEQPAASALLHDEATIAAPATDHGVGRSMAGTADSDADPGPPGASLEPVVAPVAPVAPAVAPLRDTIRLARERPGRPAVGAGAGAGGGSTPAADEPARARRVPLGAAVGGAAALAVMAAGATFALTRGSDPPLPPAPAASEVAGPTTSIPPPPTTPVTSAAPPTSAPAPGRMTAIETSGVVSYQGHRYRIGQPGDQTTIGDFRCTGAVAAVTLDPDTGDVWAFDGWSEQNENLPAKVVAHIPPGSHLVPSVIDERGCSTLTAEKPDGTPFGVALPATVTSTTRQGAPA